MSIFDSSIHAGFQPILNNIDSIGVSSSSRVASFEFIRDKPIMYVLTKLFCCEGVFLPFIYMVDGVM